MLVAWPAAAGAAGPNGSSYDFELLLGANTDGVPGDELYRIATGGGDFSLRFDGLAETLPAYCCNLGTVASVTEDYAAAANGTASLTITAVSVGGGDLFPGGLVSNPGGVPLGDAAFRIGFFSGGDPLDWSPAPIVITASVNLLANGVSVSGGPLALDPRLLFGAPGAWSGHLGVVLPQRAGSGIDRVELRVVTQSPSSGGPCVPTTGDLCLNGGRFRVSTTWRTTQGTSGAGVAVTLTGDTGFFWFFNPSNVELVVKVLNGCPVNQHFWVFAGGLTNVLVEMRVEDMVTGEQRIYDNPLGTPFAPIQDTRAFAGCGASATAAVGELDSALATAPVPSPFGVHPELESKTNGASCTDTDTAICLGDARFRVRVGWLTPAGNTGVGHAVRLTADTAYFWFFNPSNVELVVKVLDACGLGERYWVFAGGLTDVAVDLRVEDTLAGGERRYLNTLRDPYQPLQDTSAFACSTGHREVWTHVPGPPPVLMVDPPAPLGGEPASVLVRAPGAGSIVLSAVGDGCGEIGGQSASGSQLTQTRRVAAFGECQLEAVVARGGTSERHRTSFTVVPTRLELPPFRLVDGLFLPGDPPAATSGAPAIAEIEAPEEVVSGGTAQLRIRLADPAFAAAVDTVLVKAPGAAGYNGYWLAPARHDGDVVIAELRLDSEFTGDGSFARHAWRRSAADGFGRTGVATRQAGDLAVCVQAGAATTAPVRVTVTPHPVDSKLVQVSVTWTTPTDVDLHDVEPSPGIEIFYARTTSPASGAVLNRDSICRGAPENVSWPGAALPGEHIVRVDYFRACSHQGDTPYTVTTRVCGEEKTFDPPRFSGEGDRGGAGSGVEITRFNPRCTYRVRGIARYEERAPRAGANPDPPEPKGISFAMVFVRDESGALTFGEGSTDQHGRFDVKFDLPGGTRYRVEVEARQANTLVNQRVVDAGGTIYKVRGDDVYDVTDAPDRVGVEILARGNRDGGAFNVFDAGIAAATVYRSVYRTTLGPLEWVFTYNTLACPAFNMRSCMLGLNRIGVGSIPPDDLGGYDDWIILHEFGHSWVREKSWATSGADPNHSEGTRITPNQSWDEGAATFFAAVALRSPLYIEHHPGGGPTFSVESPHQYIPLGTEDRTLTGKLSETVTTATLWDLVDRTADGFDRPEYSFARQVFAGLSAMRLPSFTERGAPGPDLVDALDEIAKQLPAASQVAVPDIARCNHQFPIPGGRCP